MTDDQQSPLAVVTSLVIRALSVIGLFAWVAGRIWAGAKAAADWLADTLFGEEKV